MADGITGKVKDFFGFGDVDSFDDPYYRDEFDEDRGGYRQSGRNQDDDDRGRERGYDRDRPDRHERPDRPDHTSRSERSDYDYRSPRAARRPDLGAASASPAAAIPATPVSPAREPQVVRLALSSFQQAGELATEFKAGDIVVLNLAAMEKAEASRVLDFSVGLAKGLDGNLKKLGGLRNFALIPASVTLDQSQLDQLVEDQ